MYEFCKDECIYCIILFILLLFPSLPVFFLPCNLNRKEILLTTRRVKLANELEYAGYAWFEKNHQFLHNNFHVYGFRI